MPLASFKQTNGYFVAVSTLVSANQFAVSAPATGSGGDYKVVTFSNAGSTSNPGNIVANTMLKDMGKTVVSSTRVFRKVQAVNPAGGQAVSPTTNATGLPFYIELAMGNQGAGAPAPVAYLPGLLL